MTRFARKQKGMREKDFECGEQEEMGEQGEQNNSVEATILFVQIGNGPLDPQNRHAEMYPIRIIKETRR